MAVLPIIPIKNILELDISAQKYVNLHVKNTKLKYAMGDHNNAILECSKILRYSDKFLPTEQRAKINLIQGYSKLVLGQFAGAEKAFNSIIDLEKNSNIPTDIIIAALSHRAIAQFKQGLLTLSINTLDRILIRYDISLFQGKKSDISIEDIVNTLVQKALLVGRSKLEDGINSLSRALAIGKDHISSVRRCRILFLKGWLEVQAKNYTEADKTLERCLKTAKDDFSEEGYERIKKLRSITIQKKNKAIEAIVDGFFR